VTARRRSASSMDTLCQSSSDRSNRRNGEGEHFPEGEGSSG
jgi:hypothetical protein